MAREMKDSGIEWIGVIPKHWTTIKLKNTHDGMNVGESIDKEYWEESDGDVVFYTAGLNPITTTYRHFPPEKYTSSNDLLLARNGTPYVYLPIEKSVYTDHIIRVKIKDGYSKKYIMYCLQRSINAEIVDTVSIATWSASIWNRQCLPLPSYEEQKLIASFLDSKCAEIDKAIETTKASIEEYKKLRQAIITEAVTKGLDPDVEMKDSGIEWIGEIPATWTSMPTKNMFLIGKGLSITKDNLEETGVPTISYGQIHAKYNTGTHLDDRMFRYVNESYLQSNKQSLVHKGCFVFADTSEDLEGCGNCVYADREGEFFAGYHTVTLFPKECEDNKYFAYLFRTNEWRRQIRSVLTEVKVYSVSQKIIRRTSIIIPPASEQKEICSYLDSKCSEIDSLIKSKEKLIEELTAYRKSLIYEYVTGKKEVPAV